MRRFVDLLLADAGFVSRGALVWQRTHWRWFAPAMLATLAFVWTIVHPHDHEWLRALRLAPEPSSRDEWKHAAGVISEWGDFDRFNLIVFAIMLLIAVWRGFARSRVAAVAVLCSGALAGVVAVLIRTTIGRARPYSQAADALYGITFQTEFQGCPSGHTATAFGLAVCWLLAMPRTGWLSLPVAMTIAWSRMYLNRHYPADILSGLWVALWLAIPFGMAARTCLPTASDETASRNTCT